MSAVVTRKTIGCLSAVWRVGHRPQTDEHFSEASGAKRLRQVCERYRPTDHVICVPPGASDNKSD